MLSVVLIHPLAGCAVEHLVDIPLDSQQFISPLLLLLVLGVFGILLGQQHLDLRRQLLSWRELGDGFDLKEPDVGFGVEQVDIMYLPVSGAGPGRFLCGEAFPDRLGGLVDGNLPPQFFLFFQGRFNGL